MSSWTRYQNQSHICSFSSPLLSFFLRPGTAVVNLFRHIAAYLVANIFSCSAFLPFRHSACQATNPSPLSIHSRLSVSLLPLSVFIRGRRRKRQCQKWMVVGRGLEADTELGTFLAAVQTTGRWITVGIFVHEPLSSTESTINLKNE